MATSSFSDNAPSADAIRSELDTLLLETGFSEPDRSAVLNDPDTVWRTSKPDYDRANLAFLKGKSQNHAEGEN